MEGAEDADEEEEEEEGVEGVEEEEEEEEGVEGEAAERVRRDPDYCLLPYLTQSPSAYHQPTLSPGYGMLRSSVVLLAARTCHCRSLLPQVATASAEEEKAAAEAVEEVAAADKEATAAAEAAEEVLPKVLLVPHTQSSQLALLIRQKGSSRNVRLVIQNMKPDTTIGRVLKHARRKWSKALKAFKALPRCKDSWLVLKAPEDKGGFFLHPDWKVSEVFGMMSEDRAQGPLKLEYLLSKHDPSKWVEAEEKAAADHARAVQAEAQAAKAAFCGGGGGAAADAGGGTGIGGSTPLGPPAPEARPQPPHANGFVDTMAVESAQASPAEGGAVADTSMPAPEAMVATEDDSAAAEATAKAAEKTRAPPSMARQGEILAFLRDLVTTTDLNSISVTAICKRLQEELNAEPPQDYDKVR